MTEDRGGVLPVPSRRFTTALVAVLVVAGCGGGSGDPAGSGTPTGTTGAPTGGQVDIGGRSLAYDCEGSPVDGEPTILLVSGANLGIGSWLTMPADLASAHHFVCGFDRAGSGGSDPAPEARRTASDTVDDLLAGIDALELPTPLVLVAHSAGAEEAVLLTDRRPDLVTGVVLLDPLGPHVNHAALAALPPEQPGESPGLAEERHFLTVVAQDPSQVPEHLAILAGDREAAAVLDRPGRLWGDRPVVVLQAPLPSLADLPAHYARTFRRTVDADMRQYAAESRDGSLVRLEHTSHMVMVDQPDAVVHAIDRVLAR